MGLVINIERWDMAAAIAMATEGVRAKYNTGSGGGGFGAADMEIGAKLDGAKVLSAVDNIAKEAPHLADWSMFAYASPMWNAKENKYRLIEHVLNDWVLGRTNVATVQQKTIERIRSLIPAVAGSLALEQASGADTTMVKGEIQYNPGLTRTYLISILVSTDSIVCKDQTEQFKTKRRRHYQNHWEQWAQYVDELRTLLTKYDIAARNLYKKELELKSGAN